MQTSPTAKRLSLYWSLFMPAHADTAVSEQITRNFFVHGVDLSQYFYILLSSYLLLSFYINLPMTEKTARRYRWTLVVASFVVTSGLIVYLEKIGTA
jgi:hypothetical protein